MAEDNDDYSRLRAAVEALYYAAYWRPDRACAADDLWVAVRDAAGLSPGESARHLGQLDAVKPTNPKDAFAVSKLPLHLVPDTVRAYAALAFAEGAAKYGAYNWRVAGVRASVYRSALDRHLASWWNGEDADPATGVPHLASVIACAGIILDAELCGKLTDDRPPTAPLGATIRAMQADVARISTLFADRAPPARTCQATEQ
jgi:hypothetical protein